MWVIGLFAAVVLSLAGLWDIRKREIPIWVPVILLCLAGFKVIIFPEDWGQQLLGLIVPAALLFFAYSKGLGGGDVKLIASLGALVGFKSLLFILFPAAVLAIAGAFSFKQESIPFAPFLFVGYIVNSALIFY